MVKGYRKIGVANEKDTRRKLRRKIGKIEEIEVEGKTRWR